MARKVVGERAEETTARAAVVKTAKDGREAAEIGKIRTLQSGVRVKLAPVSASLVQDVVANIPVPDIPEYYNKEYDRMEPNPVDPKYLKDMEKLEQMQSMAATNALIMFGVDLVDPVPEDGAWLKKLRLLGIQINEKDSDEVEFAYKKYIAVSSVDLLTIGSLSGISQEDIDKAVASFRRP